MQIGQLAGAPPIAPLRTEHDQIQRMNSLDFEPARAAIARLVRSVKRLGHDAFVAGGEGGLIKEHAAAGSESVTSRGRTRYDAGTAPGQ